MKESKYNFFYEDKEKASVIAYNSRTNCLATIDENRYQMYRNFLSNKTEIRDSDFYDKLVKGGFVVDDSIDEIELIKFGLLYSRYNSDSLGLTIAPTLNCNFQCTYCYEKNSIESCSMSEEIQNQLIEFVKSRIKLVSRLSITWYGGEPLLETSIINRLTKEFIVLCEENDVVYTASIITNGYCLTEEIAKKIKQLKINMVQITIDGSKDVHDKRRPLINGKGTYNQIVNNVFHATKYFENIFIRINTDKSNLKSIDNVLDDLEKRGLKDKLYLYLGFVVGTNECYQKSSCLENDEFSEINHRFINTLKNRGFKTSKTSQYPVSKKNYCGADSASSFVIDPYGRLYKCWHDLGIVELSTGNIKGEKNSQFSESTYLGYMMYDPTEEEECRDCKLLPVCMGGCPRKRIDKVEDRCLEYKYTLEESLKETIMNCNNR